MVGRKKLLIDKEKLTHFYLEENLSTYELARVMGCTFKTIINRLREYNIPRKSSSEARNIYSRTNIEKDLVLMAYIYGFRLGDLNVYKTTEKSENVIVRCHTTHQEQVDLMKLLFGRYGQITISPSVKGSFHINCYLNNSFSFLLSKMKESWNWITCQDDTSIAFIAGYTDAEGSFLLNQNKAFFKIDSYDMEILSWMSDWLKKQKIPHKFRCICKKGESKYNTHKWNNDLWRLSIGNAHDLERYLQIIFPQLKHSRRIKCAQICSENIELRKKNGTI